MFRSDEERMRIMKKIAMMMFALSAVALVFASAPVLETRICNPASAAGVIGAEKAKEIAFAHAGILPQMAKKLKCELEEEGGRLVYDVEFEAGLHEYEYKIDAKTGEILKSKKELD
jgi:uncharacterized membrane protein YkoI